MNKCTPKPLVLHATFCLATSDFRDYETCSGIYLIVNRRNGLVYVGSAANIVKRWRSHAYRLGNGTHANKNLVAAYEANEGQDIVISLIEICAERYLTDREQYWMDRYKVADPAHGYNIQSHSLHGGKKLLSKVEQTLPNGITIEVLP